MRRVVVLGGTGFFGRAVVELLRGDGVRCAVAARHSAALRVDAEDRASLWRALSPGDVVVDAAGPFQHRSTALLEVAFVRRFDVIDLSDSVAYALAVHALAGRIRQAGIRVLHSCSAISTVAAALVAESEMPAPVRVNAFLAPASRETVHRATTASLFASVGEPVRALRAGRLVTLVGWRESRGFVLPRRRGRLVEGAISVTLPVVWPSLRDCDFWADPNATAASPLLWLASRSRGLARVARTLAPLARPLGRADGVFAVEVADGDGAIARVALSAPRRSWLLAVIPAAMAARALADDRVRSAGLVPPHRHVDRRELFARFAAEGIALRRA